MHKVRKPEASEEKVNKGGWLVWEERHLVKKQNVGRIKGAKPEYRVKQVTYSGLIGGCWSALCLIMTV